MALTTAVLCMALNIYWEARGESLTGQHAVAQVTFNRAGRNPDNVCREVFRPGQFSWANSLTSLGKGEERRALTLNYLPRDEKAWRLAKVVAQLTVDGYVADFTKGATFFHATTVKPAWRKGVVRVATIGCHIFYRKI